MALFQTLTDDWTTNNAAVWNFWGGGQITNNAGRVQLQNIIATSNYWGLGSIATYDLTNSYAIVEAVQIPTISASDPSLTAGIINLEIDSNNRYFWEVGPSDGISCYKVTAGAYAYQAGVTYNPAVHKWFAISSDGTNVYFWWATTPTGTCPITGTAGNGWTLAATTAVTVAVTALNWVAAIGNWGAGASATYTVLLDNFNLPPITTTTTTTAAATDNSKMLLMFN